MLATILTNATTWKNEHPLLSYLVPAALSEQLLPGQLVSVPYADRLLEGIVWDILEGEAEQQARDELALNVDGEALLRPVHGILDPVPALLEHQRLLAEWMAEYYLTPLMSVAQMMLPPGLARRSRAVLQLVSDQASTTGKHVVEDQLQLQALMGLLREDGELDIERLKEMLGPKRAKAMLKAALESGLIKREAQLAAPKARALHRRLVTLSLQSEGLDNWRHQAQEVLEKSLPTPVEISLEYEQLPARRRTSAVTPWQVETPSLTPASQAGIQAQRQLAAVNLLEHSKTSNLKQQWTPTKLCKASGLTVLQLQHLVEMGVIEINEVEVRRDPLLHRQIPPSQPLSLTEQQRQILTEVIKQIAEGPESEEPPRPMVLHGVTGSGKTEIYLQALAQAIAQGKRGIVLVPEIALTAQAVQRFAGRFPGRVAIIHSELSPGERFDEWRRIRSGEVDVVLGSRSALFAPVADLGLIILDEEHEPAYKQSERRPTYHARDVAIAIGQLLRIPILLGSATPSVDTYFRATQGNFQLLELPARVKGELPPVEIIDLRDELHAGHTSIISRRLLSELERILQQGHQAILYLNRRGAASSILCRECGYIALCERCDIPLTYHATERVLLCHYCNQQSKVLQQCPQCQELSMRYFGLGTEKVQQSIQKHFPTARILRWDRDTARHRHAHEQLLERFANREADILVGTQMIAKGLDLPGVTLVGVISADIALTLPDFSSSERAFTLLTQVAGRAGRGEDAGNVIIQTFNPQHFCIETAARHNYHEFYHAEIEMRQRYGYPPFRQFVKLTYTHENRHRVQNEALLLREKIDEWVDLLHLQETDVVGPAPALMEKLRGKYRWQMIVRGPDLHQLMRVLDTAGWQVDIDPVSIL